ncbi:MAG TPA: DUF6801 domain-containing protein [Streptosporangiaceae bacterium]|nr:DUF6801 domain-containing protein [Streptosporangiaceae bacterium]
MEVQIRPVPSRRSAVASVITVTAITLAGAAGIAADAPGASAAQSVNADLSYRCQSPGGAFPASVTVVASFPATAPAGQPVEPIGLHLVAQLPAAAAAYLTSLGASSVTGSGTLSSTQASTPKTGTTKTSKPSDPMLAQWPLRLNPTHLAADEPLQLAAITLTGRNATPATNGQPPKPGLTTITADSLAFDLSLAGTAARPATPAMVQLSCALASPAGSKLASVQLHQTRNARPTKKKKLKIPRGCGKIKVVGDGAATCAYLTGYADVAKLIGAALLQPAPPAKPGLANVDFAEHHKFAKGKLIVRSTGRLFYKGKAELPPITATLLAFRFVPVTATLLIRELGPIIIISDSGITGLPFPITVVATAKVSIQITKVKVNGVPLAVGPHCGTASPVTLRLVGKGFNTQPPRGYTVPTGGALQGRVTIPRFSGCGVSENLDPLFTGSISGKGNFVKQTQGKLCGPAQPADFFCPPPVPKPLR